MKPSPIGSKILSLYAFLFAGLFPFFATTVGFVYDALTWPLLNFALAGGVMFYAVKVIRGHYPAVRVFAVLVVIHYFGIAANNYWYADQFMPGSRAAEMATPRMYRSLLIGLLYIWYFLGRPKTAEGFKPKKYDTDLENLFRPNKQEPE